jgi:hypothetical protein
MTSGATRLGECAAHAGVAAEWACQRCGDFVCRACERRTRPEALPLCPPCWDKRALTVVEEVKTESKRLQIGGLVIGILSFFHPLIMLGSLILNIRELRRGAGGTRRWMNVTGVALTCVAVLVWTILFSVFLGKD